MQRNHRTFRRLALAAGLSAACLANPAWAANEFLVNTTTTGDQRGPSVAPLAGGGFVVSWTDQSHHPGDTSGNAVRAQRFAANGSKVGSEFLVNTTTTGDQGGPSVAALAGGGFVVSWNDDSHSGGDTDGTAVRAQVFAANGNKVGSEFLVNTTTTYDQYAARVTALAGGNFVISWTDGSQSDDPFSGSDVRAQVFTSNGIRIGSEFLVNTTTATDQRSSSVAALAGGGFVVSWSDDSASGGDTDSTAVRAQVFAANGNQVGGEFVVNTTTTSSQRFPSVAGLAGGGFVVSWSDDSQSGGDLSGYAVRAQRFAADGSKSGSEFLVNTTTANGQAFPSVAALTGGGFVVSWDDDSASGSDTSGSAVRAQRFAADGSKVGGEFLVNTTTANDQSSPSVAALIGGTQFVVAWSGNGTGDADGVFARLFAPPAPPAMTVGLTPASDTGTPGDGVTSVPRPTLTGHAPPGSIITVRDGTTLLGTAVADAAGLWQFTPPNDLAPGTHSLNVTAEDPVTNATATGTLAVTVGAAPPVTPPVTPPVVSPPAPTPVPTLGQWSLLLLSLLAAVPGLRRLSGKSGRSAL